jgi:hypothetical protein
MGLEARPSAYVRVTCRDMKPLGYTCAEERVYLKVG